MKIIHASDLLLGRCFDQVPLLASALRDQRMTALETIVDLVRREKADALILAGNTLADHRCGHELVMRLSTTLKRCPCPVYLLPGKTDPPSADSPYELRRNLFEAPIHILDQPLLPWSGPPVAVGCGERAPGLEAEYVAMGGRAAPHQEGRAYWCGTPEPFDYGQGNGSVNLVTFPGPRIETLPVGRKRWTALEFHSLADMLGQLQNVPPEDHLVRARLRGTIDLDERQQLEVWRKNHRFYHLEVQIDARLAEGGGMHHPLLRAMQQRIRQTAESEALAQAALLALRHHLESSGKEDLV